MGKLALVKICFNASIFEENYQKLGIFRIQYLVEYPIWVSIKRTLTGKLAVGGQKFIYCAQFGENVQKLS